MRRHWAKDHGPAYFITNTIVEWKNIFIFKPYCRLIADSWKHFVLNRKIIFYAYVIMPSHLHYIVQPTDETYGITEMQRDFKKFTAKRIIDGLKYETENGEFPVLDIFKNQAVYREPASELLHLFKTVGQYVNQAYKVWLSEEKPIQIISDQVMREKINYIHFNPVKAGIIDAPEKFPFSSARNYYLEDHSFFKISKISV